MDTIRVNPEGIDIAGLPRGGGVYLLRSGDYVKVGRTSSPVNRFRDLAGANPTTSVVGFFRHDRNVELERYLHHKLRNHRYRGEWFQLNDEQVCDIERIVAEVTSWELDACSIQRNRQPLSDPIDLGNGKWKLRLYLGKDAGGKQIRRSKVFDASGIRAARAMSHQIEAEIRSEDEASRNEALHPTIAAAAEIWWTLWCQRQRSPTTRKGYRSILDTHILQAPFTNLEVSGLTTGQVERWYASLAVGPSTVRRIHAVLTQILDQCVRDEVLDRNPAQLAYKPESRPKVKAHTTVETVLSILEAAHRRSPVRSRLLAFAALTGLRRGELCGLRWSALDLDAGILIVELNVVKAQERFIVPESSSREPVLHVKDPKSHQVAGIALDRQAVNIAGQQAAWQQTLAVVDDPYLWSVQPPFTIPLHPDTATNWFTQAAKDAGVVGVSLHDLRHWQGSQLLEVGATVQDVKERLRHKSLQTTMGYLHADHSRQRVLVDLLPQLELPT